MDWTFYVIPLLAFAAFIYLVLAARMNEEDEKPSEDGHSDMIDEGLKRSIEKWEEEVKRFRDSYND